MADFNFSVETPSNYAEKTICCFAVDTSGSMEGKSIKALNQGLQDFYNEILSDENTSQMLEVALVEFNSSVETILKPDLVENFSMPELYTTGSTKLVDGVNESIKLVEARKKWYNQTGQKYKRPWIILITDGAPDSGQDVNGLAAKIEADTKSKKYVFLPVGVEGADMSILQKVSGYIQSESNLWVQMPALKLEGLKFKEFFRWVSNSMSLISASSEDAKITLPPTSDWTTIRI
jgi:uncharacterized protein YegL